MSYRKLAILSPTSSEPEHLPCQTCVNLVEREGEYRHLSLECRGKTPESVWDAVEGWRGNPSFLNDDGLCPAHSERTDDVRMRPSHNRPKPALTRIEKLFGVSAVLFMAIIFVALLWKDGWL